MAFLVGGIVGIAMAFALLWFVMGGQDAAPRFRRRTTEWSDDADQRIIEWLAAEMDRVRRAPLGTIGPDARSSTPEPMPAEGHTRLYRTLHKTGRSGGERWDPYASNQARTYRVHTARRRARSGAVNLYAVLGVPADASVEEITRAYRSRVARIHPDKFQADPRGQALAEQTLKQLNQAVHVLRDPARRARHDAALQI